MEPASFSLSARLLFLEEDRIKGGGPPPGLIGNGGRAPGGPLNPGLNGDLGGPPGNRGLRGPPGGIIPGLGTLRKGGKAEGGVSLLCFCK